MPIVETIIAIIIAYLIGSISSAILVCKLMRLPDPRTEGSLNPGATNVLRIGGKKAAFITLVGDVLKGFLPVIIAKWIGLPPMTVGLVAFAAFIGHVFPIFFKFEGGKGVATFIGSLFALSWQVATGWIFVFALITLITRFVSLGSMLASIAAPFFAWYFMGDISYAIILACMSVVIIYRHHKNISQLIAGTERKLGRKQST